MSRVRRTVCFGCSNRQPTVCPQTGLCLVTVASWISRPFGPYHSPQASNSGDWWVVLGLDLLRSDWSKIGGWIRSLADSPNVGCDYSARHQPTGRRPSAPLLLASPLAGQLSVEVGPTWPQSPYNAVGNWRIDFSFAVVPNLWDVRPLWFIRLVGLSDPTTARQLRTGVTGGSYSVSISSAVIGVRSAVGFVASWSRPM